MDVYAAAIGAAGIGPDDGVCRMMPPADDRAPPESDSRMAEDIEIRHDRGFLLEKSAAN